MRTFLSYASALVACCAAVGSASAAVGGVTGLTTTNGNPATVSAEPTTVTSFTVASGTVTTLGTPTSATGVGNATIRPVGGADTPSSASVAADLDLGRGLANVNTGTNVFDIMFGQTLTGAAGASNDIFLLELGNSPGGQAGDDSLTVFALNAAGNQVGTGVVVNATDFGLTGKSGTYGTNGTNSLTRIIAGVALDVEDFNAGAGGIAGIRLGAIFNGVGNGIDPLAIGYNTAAVAPVPEPAGVLAVLGGLAVAARRLRRIG